MTLIDLLSQAQRYGLRVVQIADNCPLHVLSQEALLDFGRDAKRRGVGIEVGMRGLNADRVNAYLDIAKTLGADLLRVVIDAPGYEPDIDEVIGIVRSLVPRLEGLGIRLAIENHDRFLSKDFARMVIETDPQWVGICLDSVNSMGAGEGVAEVVRTLAPHTVNLHLKEFTVRRVDHKMGFVVEGLPAGQGMLNIPSLVKTIEQTGKCRSAILELWTPPEKELEVTIRKEAQWVASSVAFLKESRLFT
jgi:sugar phosphate isomerase/epimerase